jgi:hypothetical protein
MNPATGVYFRREDYASFWRRTFVDLVDFAVVAYSTLPCGLPFSVPCRLPAAP